jgi:hypothetical protein
MYVCVYIYIYTHTYTHHKEAVPWSVSLYYLWNACAAAHVCVCVYCVYIYSCVFMCVYAPTTSIIELHAPPPEGVVNNNKRGHTQTAILCVWSRARGPQHHHREWGAEGDNTHSQHSHNQTPTKPTHTREPRTR